MTDPTPAEQARQVWQQLTLQERVGIIRTMNLRGAPSRTQLLSHPDRLVEQLQEDDRLEEFLTLAADGRPLPEGDDVP